MVLVRLLDNKKHVLSLTESDGVLQIVVTDRLTKSRASGYIHEKRFNEVIESIISYVDAKVGRRKAFKDLGRMARRDYNDCRLESKILLDATSEEVEVIRTAFEAYKEKTIAERRKLYGL